MKQMRGAGLALVAAALVAVILAGGAAECGGRQRHRRPIMESQGPIDPIIAVNEGPEHPPYWAGVAATDLGLWGNALFPCPSPACERMGQPCFLHQAGDPACNLAELVDTLDLEYTCALTEYPGQMQTQVLRVSGFTFTIPTNALIRGLQVDISRSVSGLDGGKDLTIQLSRYAVPIGDNQADLVNPWPLQDTYKSYGGSTELWGASLVPVDLNNGIIGVRIAAQQIPELSAYAYTINHVRMTVWYDLPPGRFHRRHRHLAGNPFGGSIQ